MKFCGSEAADNEPVASRVLNLSEAVGLEVLLQLQNHLH